MKIFISGVSGTGKTTLAKYLSQRYRIPFIEGSTKVLWEKHKIESHLDIIRRSILTPKWGLEFQKEVLEYRTSLIRDLDSFVTDRSPLDNMVYFMLQSAPYTNSDQTRIYIEECVDAYILAENYTQIFLDFDTVDNMIYERDGMRIDNIPYQNMVNHIFKYMIENQVPGVETIEYWNWERRVNIMDFILNQERSLWAEIKGMLRL